MRTDGVSTLTTKDSDGVVANGVPLCKLLICWGAELTMTHLTKSVSLRVQVKISLELVVQKIVC